MQMKRYDEALEKINEAIQIFEKKLKKDDPILIKALENKKRLEVEIAKKNWYFHLFDKNIIIKNI